MFKIYKKEIEVAGKKISLETGKVARQADGAIIASCGETVILATVVGAKKVNPDMDYFPLSVNYQEKYYAGGKNADEVIEKLKEYSFLIRKILSKKVIIKFLPKLLFRKDESFEYAEKIENLIKQTNK